ncbi:putative bifunctional diguanylate cyclase/phosphodiesterase [Ferrimonas lipolytica]|uniref:EAL domain-containing protein n=1 Tax=Ferrimonas lipolytica TaxID=2724191 RepID=A0A6H1UIB6_9GAMM|nr:EAL domain-containing protein [Ferrimonas lipolytica]QIZ78568.1 EAL domain-containing protein [Ferrimonas lipolytica]
MPAISLSRRLMLLVFVFALPAMVVVSGLSLMQLEWHLDGLTKQQQSAKFNRAQLRLEKSLANLGDQTQQVRAALESSQDDLLQYLLRNARQQGAHLMVVNHYGELRPLLARNRQVDGTLARLLEQLQRPLANETYQLERNGFFQLEQQNFLAVILPLKHPQWRAVMQVNNLSNKRVQLLSQTYDEVVGAAIVRAPMHSSAPTLPMLFGKPLMLDITFNSKSVDSFGGQVVTLFAIFVVLAAVILIGLFLLQHHFVLSPIREMSKLLQQSEQHELHHPLKFPRVNELSYIAQNCNVLLLKNHHQRQLRDSLLRAVDDAVVVVDTDTRVELVNPAAERLLRLEHGPVQRCSLVDLITDEAGEQLNDALQLLFNSSRVSHDGEVVLHQSQETLRYSVMRTLDGQGNTLGAVMVLSDLTNSLLLKQQLRQRSQRDRTTNLFNRQVFEQALEELGNKPGQHAICYMNLNRFKLINDSCGHAAGDRMLLDVATEMSATIRSQDMLARIGGDEFGLIMKDSSAMEISKLLKELSDRVQGITLYWDSGSYKIGISIGVAFFRGEQTPYETFKDAEIACTMTRSQGGEGQISFFDSLDQDLANQRNAPLWAMRINDAIVNDDLVLFYQPIEPCNGDTRGKHKFEILLRIKEEDGRIIAPGQFIAAAERFNLMPQVDRAVIRKSFEWLARNQQLWGRLVVSINLSGTTLNSDGLVRYVDQMCSIYRVPTHTVCFEVTETAALTNENHALEILHELRQRGFSFALDDFGSGFASYGYLRRLPVDYVKIDGIFVKNLATNSKDYAIVKSIYDVCEVMGIQTVAEFVEDQEILQRLREIGITYAQGYGIARPQDLATYQSEESEEDALLGALEG